MSREYPAQSGGPDKLRSIIRAAFRKPAVGNVDEQLARGKHAIKELEALFFLTKYREMKRRYYD